MRHYRLLINYCRALTLVCLSLLATLAFEKKAIAAIDSNLVEVHSAASADDSYIKRRGDWSFRFAATSDIVAFKEAESAYYVLTFEEAFGTSKMAINQVSFGPQWNTKIGSIGMDFIAGQGSIDDGRSGDKITLEVVKKGIGFMYTIDTIFSEPIIAPFASIQFINFDYTEKGRTGNYSISGSTALSSVFTLGTHLSLNWLDESAARRAYAESGLVATMVDIYAVKYQTSTKSTDADFQTTWELGAGLRLEF